MFVSAVKSFFKNYFNFSGRATRAEFWCVAPIVALICWAPLNGTSGAVLEWLFPWPATGWGPDVSFLARNIRIINVMWISLFICLIPAVLSLVVRRLHDAGFSEWRLLTVWIILPYVFGPLARTLGMHRVDGGILAMPIIYYNALYVYGLILLMWPGRDR